MSAYSEVRQMWERLCRDAKLATTYMRKVENGFYAYRSGSQCVEPPTDYWTLLDQALSTARMIVEVLPASFFETTDMGNPFFGMRQDSPADRRHNLADGPLEAARALVSLLEARIDQTVKLELIRKLEAVQGRTPEETEAYLAKARQLRESMEASK